MTSLDLKLQPLTSEAFAPFGDVIELNDSNEILSINYGLTDRHHDLAKVDVGEDGRTLINLFHSRPIELPYQIKVMERHPLGSQAFVPLSGNPYVVIVSEPGELDFENLHGFLAQPHQGVNYHKGTWHHYSLTLNSPSTFAVVDRSGPGNNCDEIFVPEGLTITVTG